MFKKIKKITKKGIKEIEKNIKSNHVITTIKKEVIPNEVNEIKKKIKKCETIIKNNKKSIKSSFKINK